MWRIVPKPEYLQSKSKVETWENIDEVDIGEFDEKHMTSHGMNRNLKRDIPFFFDNLKVVQRRILYTMALQGLTPTKLSKAANIVGDVLKRHPHGDQAAWEAMIFLRQPWRHLLPLISTSGNYGNAKDAGSYASMRYVECGLSEFALDCFFDPAEWDLKSNVVDMKPNFDGSLMEPLYLPAKYPLFLMSWSKGIGHGLATSSPGFLPQDAMQAVIDLIDNPSAKVVLYPEDPSGCDILDKKVFKKFVDYKPKKKDKNLKFRVRSKYKVDENGNIVVLNVPYEVNMMTIYESIIKLVKANKLDGIVHAEAKTLAGNIPQLSEKSDVANMWIEVKKGFDPHILMERLFKLTEFEKTFSLDPVYVLMDKNVRYNLRESILKWIEFRRRMLTRMYRLKLNQDSKRVYVLDAIIKLFDTEGWLDQAIDIIKKNGKKDAIRLLYTTFNFSDYQAEKVADLRLINLNPQAQQGYKEERANLLKSIEKYSKILKKKKAIDDIIKQQMQEGIKKYSRVRQSRVYDLDDSTGGDASHTISVTHNGFVKKLPLNVTENGELPEGSKLVYMEHGVPGQDKLFIFTPTGRVFSEFVHKLSTSGTEGVGVNMRHKTRDESLEFVSAVSDDPKTKASVLFVTRKGIVKQSKLVDYFAASQNGSAIKLNPDDTLIEALRVNTEKDKILIYTKNGTCVLYSAKDITVTSRSTVGVIGIRMEEGDEVAGACVVRPSDTHIITVSDKGEMKRISLETSLTSMKRGDNGITVTARTEVLNTIFTVSPKTEVIKYMVGSEVRDLVVADVPVKTRVSNGDKMINALRGERLIRVIG